MKDRKNGSKTDERNPDGTFASGNPGRPRGARHKITQAIEAMLEGQHEALTQAAIDKALEGDVTALRLCLDRIAPARKDAPVSFALPEIETAEDAAKAARAILKAIAEGDVTPLEAATVMAVVEQFRRTLETTEIERRIVALEAIK
ncbi:hypothetical protein A9Q96_09465 [Rhodobacterales bacterium 52_120_T64]|jgi:hypothetical protein|nr:hypothetical protein A9Q96_09465 [Rhodobacterales bacterium 52_120_T64]BDY15014.1 hypothetical protein Sulfitobl28_09840 [Sulfitobacter pontiacus]|tara:strand:+ start:102 stop:539 length:438 start_codon:yes stop_codon:yes gene_type:complete